MSDWSQSAEMAAQLRLHEGVRGKPYRDTVGKITIGVGRNLSDVGLRPDEIDLLLRNDIAAAQADLDRVMPWWRQMSDGRQRALLDMCFNMGIGTLRGFKATLTALQSGDWRRAAAGIRGTRYARQVGARAEAIARSIETGIWVCKSEVPS